MNDPMKWEKLSSRYLVKERWATLRVDACRMPDGTIVDDYYVLEYPNWVNAVALTEDNQVILIRQYRHAAGEVMLEIPGGCIDPGEEPEEAIRRELLEETGYAFDHMRKLGSVYANPSTAANRTFSYLFTGGRKVQEQHLDGREQIDVLLVSMDEFKNLTLTNKFPQALHSSASFQALVALGELK